MNTIDCKLLMVLFAERKKILFMIFNRTNKKLIPLIKDVWYRVELLQEQVGEKSYSLTLRVNGFNILSAKSDEEWNSWNLWASPRRGKPPAPGLIRAVTVFYTDDLEDLGIRTETAKIEGCY